MSSVTSKAQHSNSQSVQSPPRLNKGLNEEESSNDEDTASQTVSRPLLKLKLLDYLRQGSFTNLKQLIDSQFQPKNDPNVKAVKSLILHYAVQVAPLALIKEIVAKWSGKEASDICLDINQTDENGNTPLHLAAFQSRGDVVSFLMDQPNVNDCVLNNSNLQPIEMCKNLNIAQMMQVKRAHYVAEIAQEFRTAFNNRDFGHLESILSAPRNAELLDINGMDPETGDTVLHEFVKKRDVIMCRWLLEHGADPFKRDRQGKLPIDLVGKVNENNTATNTKTAIEMELKKLLSKAAKEQSVIDVTNNLNEAPTYKGYLKKWTNFAQGYKLRWFILSKDGKLSYYKDQSDTKNACRGSLSMSTCYLHLDSSEKLKFEIIGGSDGTIRWHLKANHPIETNRWVWAIQGAIRFSKDREMMNKSGNIPPSLAINKGAPSSNNVQKLHSYERQRHPLPLEREEGRDRHHNRVPSASSSTKPRKPSATSSEVNLNDNLTESGKLYVNKVLENRESTSRASSIKHFKTDSQSIENTSSINRNPSSKSNEGAASQSGSLFGTESAFADGQNTSMDQEGDLMTDDEENTDVVNGDDEDVVVLYGPYAVKLAMLQRSIAMDLSSLNELLESGSPDQEAWSTIKTSLATVSTTFEKMNSLSSARDKKLVSMLSKQRDINNVWIQSVKDLEIELIEKSNRLASLDKERRNLKKLLQKGLVESSEPANVSEPNLPEETPNALEEIAKFIDATKGEDEGSDADEFYDAEELVEASTQLEEEKAEEIPKKEIPSDLEIATKSRKPVSQPPLEEERTEEPSEQVSGVTEVETQERPAAQEDEKKPASSGVDEVTSTIAVTPEQEQKGKLILSEGTYLGYEDGIRKRLKLDKDDRPSVSLWSVLKSMVGKDMTRMTLPVTFNEPTSLLQRVAEDLEYTHLLDEAASFEDPTLRLLYVGVFTASSYASTIKRVAKPFNPLLGETFEYARPDKHFRFFTEQVSHHPPISATWTESPKWDFYGESNVDSKFNGRSFAFKHLGWWHISMRPDDKSPDELYTWKKPDNTVIGILVGNPQVDNHGDVKIVNHTTGDYCMLNFKARGWRSSGAYEMRGEVFNKKGQKMWVLGGHWNDTIYGKKVTAKDSGEIPLQKTATASSSAFTGPKFDGSKFLIWKTAPRPDAPFNLTPFAITLNAPQPKLLPWLAPTDTRLRPDQRDMEDGRYDEAAKEKHRVEEKQRAERKKRESKNEKYCPKWFVQEQHPITKNKYWRFNGNYWMMRKEHKLKNCGDIF
ncbi:OSBP family protein TDEL_0D04480 [Torulaspora delbrueckii]|uniref:PH domain-containing protein n=1 Tax=Torulaspora delbrueckii TaxID=4950 RepID=G8ZTT8_TORDE|nr:hypothetical protein TDEL_0D04480 [Torulaspora delbrueckii]CCE92032.1 hypothetical protein TDEL_0D04480 [Torulaspora delbrueckii]